ncbi:RNA polymerase sigma factor [Aquirufa beregesia]|nr:sigma-70 family RNA polymerase sigma factor [Aquirufa beregesia]
MDYSQKPDNELCQLLHEDDSKAFEIIYKRYFKYLYRYVNYSLGVKEDSEEIIHDLFLSLWQNRKKNLIGDLKVYLYVSTRNLINKNLRMKLNFSKYREFELFHKVLISNESEEISNSNDFNTRLNLILDSMSGKTAQVFRMSKIEEISVKKISDQLKISEKAVEYHITKSQKILRERFKDFYSEN